MSKNLKVGIIMDSDSDLEIFAENEVTLRDSGVL